MSLCKYKNSLGKPGKGVHFHVAGIAILDVIWLILFAWVISRFSDIKLLYVILALIILGIVVHRLFCVKAFLS